MLGCQTCVWMEGFIMSSYLIAAPEALATASADLSGIGEAIRAATAAAAPSTTSVVAAAQDEVSAAISKLFGGYGQEFQSLSAQAGLFHSSFVQSLTSGGNLYAAAESANASIAASAASITTVGGAPFSPFLDTFRARAVRQRRRRHQRRGRHRRGWQ